MSAPAAVAVIAAFVVVFALLTAAATGKLARLGGATYPTALLTATAAFTTVLTLAATLTTALTPLLR